jgi:poly-gamma-glutamate system protein
MEKNLKNLYLIVTFMILLIFFILLKNTAYIDKDNNYTQKIEAAQKMKLAIDELGKQGEKLGINLGGKTQVERSPLLGIDFSDITTTLGSEEAKKTSINPNFAAVVVDMLEKLNLNEEDKVAVNFSSSFPAINIAVLCALDAMNIDSIVISSIGASTHGGNNPDFTYVDMEKFLFEKGILNKKSDQISYGGKNDLGEDINRKTLEKIVIRTGFEDKLIKKNNYEKNLEKKIDVFSKENIKCFINVGGNTTALGKSYIMYEPGIITKSRYKDQTGLIGYYLNRNIPVLHFLNIKKIAGKYGLTVNPSKVDSIGDKKVYFKVKYSAELLIVGIIIGIMGVMGYGFMWKKYRH